MLKSRLKLLAYSLRGWSTSRKIVLFESDDWGTIRMSLNAKKDFERRGIIDDNPFNRVDSLENAEDFSALFDVLKKYKDGQGNPPVITANTIMANPDFDKIKKSNYQAYHYELFTETYRSYWSRNDTFDYFSEGIREGFLKPQFHGREHVNVQGWLKCLQSGNEEITKAFEQRVFGIDFKLPGNRLNNLMATFDFYSKEGLEEVNKAVEEGLELFEQTFGIPSHSVIAPVAVWHPDTAKVMKKYKVKYLQGYITQKIPKPSTGPFRKAYHYQGEVSENAQKYIVRNCYFEPSTDEKIDWVDNCLTQIKRAFLLRKPAVIATHRINFSGGIEETNRSKNLILMDRLLKAITTKWPDVEFMASDDVGLLMDGDKKPYN